MECVCMYGILATYYLLTQTIIPGIGVHASTKVGHGASSSRFISMRDTRRLRGLCCYGVWSRLKACLLVG